MIGSWPLNYLGASPWGQPQYLYLFCDVGCIFGYVFIATWLKQIHLPLQFYSHSTKGSVYFDSQC